MKSKPSIYRINYINHNKVYELYAQHISTEILFGFMSVSDILFDLKDGLVIDPVEEQLKAEFSDVEVLHVPLNHVLKVEQVKQKKSCKIRELNPNHLNTIKSQQGPTK